MIHSCQAAQPGYARALHVTQDCLPAPSEGRFAYLGCAFLLCELPRYAGMLTCTALPSQVLFFARLFADVTGRVAPRLRVLAPQSPLLLAALGVGMVATLPGYFLYIRAGPRWHSDAAAVGAA